MQGRNSAGNPLQIVSAETADWPTTPRETDPLKCLALKMQAIELLAKSAKTKTRNRTYFPSKSARAEAIVLWNRSGAPNQSLDNWSKLRNEARRYYHEHLSKNYAASVSDD